MKGKESPFPLLLNSWHAQSQLAGNKHGIHSPENIQKLISLRYNLAPQLQIVQKAVKVAISCGKNRQMTIKIAQIRAMSFVFGAQFQLTTLVGKIINCYIFETINSLLVYLLIKVCVWRMIRLQNVKYRWQSYGYYSHQVSDVIENFASGNLQRFTVLLLLR